MHITTREGLKHNYLLFWMGQQLLSTQALPKSTYMLQSWQKVLPTLNTSTKVKFSDMLSDEKDKELYDEFLPNGPI
jgi:hypothetical protein